MFLKNKNAKANCKKKFQSYFVSLCLEQTLDLRNNNPIEMPFRLEVLMKH